LDLPLLLMHGSDDESVSPVQTLRLARELAEARKEFGVIIFPGGDHTLTQRRVARDERAVEFFRMYMVE
ncbi:MAG: prolyl oligopeptidase family serine peptidase, partial [Gemmatimonadales bacterium]